MAEKPCAHPRCACPAEPGKEFCSSNCREAKTGDPCSCAHKGAETSISNSSPHGVREVITDDDVRSRQPRGRRELARRHKPGGPKLNLYAIKSLVVVKTSMR